MSAGKDVRHTVDGVGNGSVGRDEPQPPRTLGDQQRAVGQVGRAPGMLEPFGKGLDRNAACFALDAVLRERGRGRSEGEKQRRSNEYPQHDFSIRTEA